MAISVLLDKPQKIDRRIVKTQRAIREAFYRLIAKKNLSKVTVSELAREADIDRKTFYLHYRSIDELVQQEVNLLVFEVIDSLAQSQGSEEAEGLSMRRLVIELARVAQNSSVLFDQILHSLTIDQMINALFDPVKRSVMAYYHLPDEEDDVTIDCAIRFKLAGTLSVFIEWFNHRYDAPIEEIADIVERISESQLKTIHAETGV